MGMKNEVVMILVFLVLGLVFLSASNSIVNKLLIGNVGLRGTCHDTDSGVDLYNKGTVSGIAANGVSYERTDYCVSAYQLKEYSCDPSSSTKFKIGSDAMGYTAGGLITCEKGCSNGACIR